jgi:hypothetical protein
MRAHLLGALVLDHLGQHHAHLVVVRHRERVLQLVVRLVHLARRGHRHEVDDVLLELHRHRRQVRARADVRHHHEDLVLVDQLLRRQHRTLGVVGRVFDDQLDLAAVDAALLVDLVHAQHHAQACLLAERGDRPDRSWIEPSTISSLVTPCWASTPPAANAAARVIATLSWCLLF